MQTFSEKMPYQTMIRKILCHSLFMVTALQAKPFHDVPMNHWAYEAISQLSAINVIVGRSPSAFDGAESLSRYELAEVTAKLMIELENSNLGSSENILLERLNQEFSEELDLIQNRYQKMERAILGHLDQGHEETNQKLTFSGINRIRNEWWKLNSNDLNQGLSDELTWMRTRIGLSQRLDKAKVYVELQHSTSFGNGANSNGELADDPLAMYQAFGQLKFGRKNTSSIQIGRFAMSYGDETLIGNNDWNNVGHTFDGFRYSFQDQKQSFEMDAFYTNLSDDTGGAAIIGGFPNPGNPDPTATDNQFMGLNLNWKRILRGEFNLFYFKRNQDQAGASDRLNTTGFNWTRTKNHWSYYFQYAIQSGQTPMEGVDYGGQMQRITVSHEMNHNVQAAIDYQNYTGDKSSTLDTFESWQSLYPTVHNILGYADRINQEGPAFNHTGEPTPNTNIGVEDLSFHLSWKPAGKYVTKLAYHRFRAHHLGANISSNLGSEIDLLFAYQWSEDVAFEIGYALYQAGHQPDDRLPGVSGTNARFGWLSTKTQF